MKIVDKTISINQPVELVFRYISNPTNSMSWFPGIAGLASFNDLPHGMVGKIYTEQITLPSGRRKDMRIHVVEVEPNRRFVTEGQMLIFKTRMEVDCRELQEGVTELHWVFSVHSPTQPDRRLSKYLLAQDICGRSETGLQRLKALLET
ncbi:MAG: hypothetical protein COA69_04050 [Robiginitomaculum sp.]|nr:MAG: hypothetical protein COA69_04050 [Robiginitomaculum sp.]